MNTDKPILQLMDEFLANHAIRENSRKKYRDNLHYFINWITRNGDVINPTKADLIRFREYLIRIGRTANTIDSYMAPVRLFLKYLAEIGVLQNVTAWDVKSPKKSKSHHKLHLQEEQVNALLLSINRSTMTGLRDFAIINMMVRTGMRCVEVSRADVRDLIIEDDDWIIYIQGKGHVDKDRALGLSDMVVDPIKKYISENNLQEDSPLFLNHSNISNGTRITTLTISKIIKRYLRVIGVDSKRITAHSLRHTAAVTALKMGADILDVRAMLGHQSVETTMIYQRSIEEERMRKGTTVRLLDNAFNTGKNNSKNSNNMGNNQPPG